MIDTVCIYNGTKHFLKLIVLRYKVYVMMSFQDILSILLNKMWVSRWHRACPAI